MSRQERELLVQNDQLNRAAQIGQDSADVAISTKINLQAQTEKVGRITDNVVDMRREDISQGGKLLTEI